MAGQKMIELAAEQDETLMEKFFEDPNSLSEEEIVAAIRRVRSHWISFP